MLSSVQNKKLDFLIQIGLTFVLIVIGITIIFSRSEMGTYMQSTITESSVTAFNNGWAYEWSGEGKREIINLPYNLKGESFKELHLTNKLPGNFKQDGVLFFMTSEQNVKIYINDNLIYQYGEFSKSQRIKPLASLWHMVKLPSDYGNGKIDIFYMSPYKQFSGSIHNILVGDKNSILYMLVIQNIYTLLVGGIIIFIGILCIALFFIINIKKEEILALLFFGMFSISLSTWLISESNVLQIIFDKPVSIFYSSLLSLFFMPIPFLLFLLHLSKPKRDYMLKSFIAVFVLFFITAAGLQVFNIVSFRTTLPIYHVILFLSIIVALYIIIDELRNGNKRAKTLIWGCTILAVIVVGDLILFYIRNISDLGAQENFRFQYGVLLFTFIMARGIVHNVYEIFDKHAQNKVYEMMAYTDALTKLGNKASFEDAITKLNIEINKRNSISIIVFDLNNLKQINDTLGHKEGDSLLRISAQFIQDHYSTLGKAYRIGGDEFVVVICDKDKKDIHAAVSSFNNHVKEYNNSNNILKISIAYGISFYDEIYDKDIYSTFSRADKEMYNCKFSQKQQLEYKY